MCEKFWKEGYVRSKFTLGINSATATACCIREWKRKRRTYRARWKTSGFYHAHGFSSTELLRISVRPTRFFLRSRVRRDEPSLPIAALKTRWCKSSISFLLWHVSHCISAPSVQIVDALGEPLRDKYYEADSTIELLCVVRHMAMQVQYSVVQWLHGNRVLNYDTTRGGIRWHEPSNIESFFRPVEGNLNASQLI